MPADALAEAERSPLSRSAVTNGTRRFGAADGRSRNARRLRDLEHDLAAPLGALATLAPSERMRVQSAAALSLRLEDVRSGLARGSRDVSDEDLVRLSNGLARELSAIDRLATAKRKTTVASGPDALRLYLAEKAARTAEVAA